MAIDFNNTYPWSDIREVTIDGQAMVWIPKFYVKTGKFTSGTYTGKKFWLVSGEKLSGYHVHPAFMRNGVEKDGFYIGKYFAWSEGSGKAGSAAGKSCWVNINQTAAKNACLARNDGSASGDKAGWHLKTIYEWAAIQLLCLIETGSPNVQSAIGYGSAAVSGNSNAKWRGICDMWCGYWEHTDGYYTDGSNKIFIFNNTNNGSYVNTGLTSQGGWIKDVADAKGTNFDCGDIFLPQTMTSSETDATFSDYAWSGSNCVVYTGGIANYGSQTGLFTWAVLGGASYSNSILDFRLAKYDI